MKLFWKRSLAMILAVLMVVTILPVTVFAEGSEQTNPDQEVDTATVDTSLETESEPQDALTDGSEGKDKLPDATVSVLDPIVLTQAEHDYMVWPSGDDTIDRPLQIVMNFKANETQEEAAAGAYGDYKCDFYLTCTGLAEGSIVANDCYLAGNYGSFGWIVIPTDGVEIDEGVSYPIVSGYDANLKYAQDICGSVKNFTAAIYISEEILEANPNFKVSLALKMTNPNDENDVLVIGEPAVYTVEDLLNGATEKESPVVIPEDVVGDATVVEEIKNNTALKGYTPENLPEGAELVIELKSVENKIVYDVTPMADGTKVELTKGITFRLPIPASVTDTHAKVYHDGETSAMGCYAIKGDGNGKYIEIYSKDFSEYAVETLTPDNGCKVEIYNADGTPGWYFTDESEDGYSIKEAIEWARMIGSLTADLEYPVTYVVEMYEDSAESESFEIGSDVVINGNGHKIVCAEGVTLTNNGTLNDVVVEEPAAPAVKIGTQGYATLADALAAAKSMTGDVVVEIYNKAVLNTNISGSFDSIRFVGKSATAEIYLDVQGYITATGKKVAFENLTLSKSAGGYITNAGFMNTAFGVYDVVEVTYTNCKFTNGAYASSGNVTFTGCTFGTSHDKYGLWAYGNVDVNVDNCFFEGARGIKMYAEGAAKTVDLTVKNTDFSKATGADGISAKPAIVLTYGESVTLEGNTYSSTGVFELDKDGAPNGTTVVSDVAPTCKNDDGVCGVLVDGKIYTTVVQAADVAVEGSTVTLLHDSAETVELPKGVILDKNGFEAAGVTVEPPMYLAQVGDAKYETVKEAVEAAVAAGITDLVIILTGDTTKDSAIAVEDAIDLYTQNVFNSVTLKQEDPSKVYYISCLYTGSRTNGGAFTFDGVNIVVLDQYIFEGNVVLSNNSIIKSTAEANCFIYNGETTIKPGSKLYGVIEDFRGGNLVVDGGRTDGSYNTDPDLKDAIMYIRWSGNKLVLKNGAYVNINAANEVGRLTLSAGTSVESDASKLDVWQYIEMASGSTMILDTESRVTTKKITGSGVITIDATNLNGIAQVITADMSEFIGTVEVVNNDLALYEITATGVVVKQAVATISGKGYYATLQAAVDAAAEGDTITLLSDIALAEGIVIAVDDVITINLNGKTVSRNTNEAVSSAAITNNGNLTIVDESLSRAVTGGKITAFAANPDTADIPYYANNTITNCGVLTIKGGTIENSTGDEARAAFPIDNNSTSRDAILNIEGGTIIGRGAIRQFANSTTHKNEVNITGGTVNGTSYGLWMQNPGSGDPKASLSVSGGEVAKILLSPSANFEPAISGGTVSEVAIWDASGDANRDPSGFITGGTVETYDAGMIAEGYKVDENGAIVPDPIYGKVAKVGDTYYATLADAIAAAKAGDELVLIADVTLDSSVTLPAGITLNGNGKSITGYYVDANDKNVDYTVYAGGDITFAGHSKIASFNVSYTNTTINIDQGACLEIVGAGRLVIGHGCTFNINGTITDAKTADKTAITPSLIMPGASFTGAGVTFNVTNAYIKAPSSYCSSSKSASGTFDFNINNSIVETAGKLAFEAQSTAATVNFKLKNSVLTTGSHLVFGVSRGEIVIDNSNVNVGTSRQIENRSTMTIKNGSVVNGAVATSSNAINPGTIIVENATYAVTGQFSGAAEGIGTLIIKKGATVSVGSIVDKANIQVDATGMTAGDEVNFTGNLSKFTGTTTVINNDKLEAKIVDGKIVLAVKPVASINGTTYATFVEAFAAATDGDTITLLADVELDATLTTNKSITIDGNGKTITTSVAFVGNASNAMIDIQKNITFNNVVFDGVKGVAVMRAVSANVVMDECVVKNCEQTVSQGLLRLACGNATITNSQFLNNDCTMVLSFGYDAANDTDVLLVDNCTFEGNTCGDVAVVYFANGNYGKVTNTEFIDNSVSSAGNAATLYMGWGTGYEVSGCLFDGNSVTTSHATTKRFASAIFADGCKIENNIFLDNTATRNGETINTVVAVAAYYGEASVSGNYWNGGEPAFTIEYNRNDVVADNYYASYDESTGALSNKTEISYVAKVGVTPYKTLADAIAAAQAGDTITLVRDVVLTETLTIPAGKTITLDLNGKTISQEKACTSSYEMIANNGTLTITGNGKISFKDTGAGDASTSWGSYTIRNSGTLVVENGTIEHLGEQNQAGQAFAHTTLAIFQYSGSTTINGGTISTPNYRSIRLWSGDLTINGGTFDGQVWVHCVNDTAKLTIKGGSFSPNGNDGSSVFVNNSGKKAELSVAGGTFETKIGADSPTTLEGDLITGGTFTEKAVNGTNSALIADGFMFGTADANGNFSVVDDPKTHYISTLDELKAFRDDVNAGNTYNGVTVYLAADIDLAGINWVGIGSATAEHGFMGNFDGNGFKIKNLTITNPALDSDGYAYAGLFAVTEGTDKDNQNTIKNLIIENVTIKTTGHIVAAAIAYPYYTIVDNVTVRGDIKIEGGNYTSGVLAYTRRCVNASNLTISGNSGSYIKGAQTVGGVISDIQMNGGLTAVYSNFAASGLTITGTKQVGGISGIIATQTLDGATVKNVTLVCDDARVGIVAGSLGGTSTVKNIVTENVTGATAIVGAAYDSGLVVVKNGDVYTAVAPVAEVNGAKFATLQEAIDAAQAGETVTMLTDVELTETLTVNGTVTLELNGKKLSGVNNEAKASAVIKNNGSLTIQDTVGNGIITSKALNPDLTNKPTYANNTISNFGTLTVKSGIIENASTGYACYAIDNYSGSATVIEGGIIHCVNGSNGDSIRLFASASANTSLVVTGGEVGTIWAQNPSNNKVTDVLYSVTIEDGATVGTLYLEPTAEAEVAITGGKIDKVVLFKVDAENPERNASSFISGGTFSSEVPAEYCAEGFEPKVNNDGTFGVLKTTINVNTDGNVTVNGQPATAGQQTTIDEIRAEVAGNNSLSGYDTGIGNHVVEPDQTLSLDIALEDITIDENGNVTQITYNVAPMIHTEGEESVKITEPDEPITFRLPISPNETRTHVVVYHEGNELGIYEVKVDAEGHKYVEVTSDKFSSFTVEPTVVVAEIGGTLYNDLADAFVAAKDGDEIVLTANTALNTSVSVAENISVTLNLNGFTITGTDNATGSFGLINIQPGAELTINGDGKITLIATNNRGWNAYSSVISNQRGKLTVNGGTIEHLGGTDMAYAIDILTNTGAGDAKAVINGGTIKSTYRAIRQFANSTKAETILTINGGTIESTGGNKAIWIQNANASNNPAELTVDASAVVKGDVLVSGSNATAWTLELSVESAALQGESTVVGSKLPATMILEKANGVWGTVEAVATVNGVGYETLADAFAAAQNGDTIVLLANITSDTISIVGKDVTLDLAGHVLSGTCNAGQSSLIYIENGAKLTVEDSVGGGKITFAQGTSNVGWTIDVKGEFVLESGTIELTGSWSIGYAVEVRPNSWGTEYQYGSKFTMNGGSIISSDGGVRVASSSAAAHKNVSASFVMNGGLIDAAWDGVFVQQSDTIYDDLSFTINGGTIESDLNPVRVYGPAPTGYVNDQDCMSITLAGGTLTYTGTETQTWVIEGILRVGGGSSVETIVENGELVVTAAIAQSATAPEGFEWVDASNGNYTLAAINYVAQIGEQKFESLADALEAAQAGETVTLLEDVTINALIALDKEITLDLGGKKVTSTAKKAFEVYADVTIQNGTIEAVNRCVDTRKAVELTLNNVTLTADNYTSAYGNPQPLTIGGYENHTIVYMTGVTINAAAGYGIITFVDTNVYATNCTINGYNALYVKEGSDHSKFEFVNSDLIGSTGGNDVEGNSFSTIAVRANDIHITLDENSSVVANGNYCYAISLSTSYEGDTNATNSEIIVKGTITGNFIDSAPSADNTVSVRAEYADELSAIGYVTSDEDENGLINITAKGVASVNGKNYATVNEAISAAQAQGMPVTLESDIKVDMFVVNPNVEFDLNGHIVESSFIAAFGNIVDNGETTGGIKVESNSSIILQPTNTHMPLYDATNGCYRFYAYTAKTAIAGSTATSVRFAAGIFFEKAEAYALLANDANGGLSVKFNISWEGSSKTIGYGFSSEKVAEYATAAYNQAINGQSVTKAFFLNITGLDTLASGTKITTEVTFASSTNVSAQNVGVQIHTVQ